MLIRFILALLWVCYASPLYAAAHVVGGPQDITYQNEAGQNEAGQNYEGEEADESALATPPPVLRAAPTIITTGPMGTSPLTVPMTAAMPAPTFVQTPVPPPVPPPVPMTAPTIITGPSVMGTSRGDAVERGELAAPVLTTYGVLDERSGALPMDVWRTLTYRDALAVLATATQRVMSGSGNVILSDVLRVAALSRTYEPSGPTGLGGADLASAFFNARVMAAQAAGDRDGALTLFRQRPGSFKLQDWQSFIENEIRQRRFTDVCAISADKLAQDLSAFAQKVSILCDIKDGHAETARLHLDLLREAASGQGDGDTLFLELAERALNPNVTSKSKQAPKQDMKLENLSTLHIAAITLGKPKLKPEQIDRLMSPAYPILLDVPMADAPRLKYAESFARAGQLSSQDYQGILASMKFPVKAIAQFRRNPESLLTVPEKEWPPALRRAAALQAISDEDNHAQKARIITAAMAGLTNADLLGALGDSLLAQISDVAALPDNLAAAPAMARLLLLRGNPEAANWWRLASASPANREVLLPIFPLALLRGVIHDDDRTTWFENYGRTQLLSAEKKSQNLAMIKLLGVMLPSDEESQLAAQGVLPDAQAIDKRMDALMSNLEQGSSEALLRALMALKAMHQNALAEKLVLLNL